MQPVRTESSRTCLLAVFSFAGGVGKTSLVANLGRALSSQGESVALVDTTSHGLLPIYFSAPPVSSDEAASVPPPSGSITPPISVAIFDVAAKADDERQEATTEQVLRNGQGHQRLLLDLASGSSWLLRRMADLHPVVLVPLAPDMNSVVSLQAVEKEFRTIADSDGRPLRPYYVLNQFDATLPLHLDVREVLRRQLGDRLLRTAIRCSQAVSEALAQGATVLDCAPEAPVSHDYLDVASWLRSISAPVSPLVPAESRNLLRGQA
jgi:cellulose biosynthesis protein BcsQ